MARQASGYVDRDGRVHLACTAINAGPNGFCRKLRRILNHFVRAPHHVRNKNLYLNMDGAVANVAHQASTCGHAEPAEAPGPAHIQSRPGDP